MAEEIETNRCGIDSHQSTENDLDMLTVLLFRSLATTAKLVAPVIPSALKRGAPQGFQDPLLSTTHNE